MRTFTTFEEIEAAAGEEIGVTDWVQITQERVDQFAEATGDTQWIHVDVEKAKAGPFGGTIAHGYLTLSLVPWLGSHVFAPGDPGRQAQLRRQQGPLPEPGAGRSSVRAKVSVKEVIDIPAGKQLTARLRDRDRGPGQAGVRRRDGRPAAALSRSADPVDDQRRSPSNAVPAGSTS